MLVEFKEKTYEKYFGHEVARLTNVTYSPDQCDEAFLGFDDAFYMHWRWHALHLPFVRRRRWALRQGILIKDLDHIAADLSHDMPPFKFNLFVQYKRPEYLTSKGAAEWSCWKAPYFRYQTTPHQQILLEKIDQQSKGRAATVYASAAFWKKNTLWDHAQAETVIPNSNIASVGTLKGHARFTYVAAGFRGKGHSDPVGLESPSLTGIVQRGLEQDAMPFNVHVKRMANLIVEVLREDEAQLALFEKVRAVILGGGTVEGRRARDPDSFTEALLTIDAFSEAFETTYCAMG